VNWLVVVLASGLAVQVAHGQPVEEQDGARKYVRGGFGGGISNRVSADEATLGELGGTLNLEVDVGLRFRYVSFSWYSELTLREFSTIGSFYKRISKERGKEIAYGYLFGWLAGTSLIYSGPALTFYTKPKGLALFASAGIGPLLLIDPRDPDAASGYGQMLGVGLGNEKFRIAVRAIFSGPRQHRNLAGPDPTYYNVFVTVAFRKRQRKTSNNAAAPRH